MKRLRRSDRMAVVTVVIVGAFGGAASAYFTAPGAGTTSAHVGTLSPPSIVEATPTNRGATVRITRNAIGTSPESYDLERNTDAKAAPAPSCETSTKSLTTTCKDLGAPAGTYTYTVVARYRSFSASADSNEVAVVKDVKVVKPEVTLTSPADASPGNIDTSTANTFIVDTSAPAVTLTSPADASPMATTLAQGTDTVQATQTDTAGNIDTSTANTSVLDTTAPKLSTLHMLDRDANGKVDEVKATFSETLATSHATEPWTLTNVPSGGTLSAVSTSGTDATLTIDEGSGAADTSIGTFKVALTANASAIRDPAGNPASFVATTPSDRAGPVLMTATSDGGTTTDLMQPDDTLALTFSEALAPSSMPDSPDVTESRSAGSATLAITGLLAPAAIDFGYLGKVGDSATSSTASALTDETVTVTLDTLTTDGSVAAGSGGARIFPAASLKDPAGNAAASAAPATGRLVSPLF